jgi:hypothetical protein
VFLLGDDLATLRQAGTTLPAPLVPTSLLELAAAAATIDVHSEAGLRLRQSLRPEERRWIESADMQIVAAIRSRVLGTVGVIAVRPKLSGLPYSQDDREFLSAVAAAVGLTFDSLRLKDTQRPPAAEPAGRECAGCGSIYAPQTMRCRCGRELGEAAAPFVLRGVFRFERRIGAGGTGVVYRAVDLGLGRTVAIKILSSTRPDQVEVLIREARDMARLSHEHLAVIHAVERWREMPLLVQEYLDGGTLAHRLTAAQLALPEIAELGRALVAVLERVHAEGIVHCDVKPSNIGYTRTGVVKLFDFGLARPESVPLAEGQNAAATFAGTPYYMSPAAIRGEPPNAAFDWWSLSVVLFEAIAGRRPFDGQDTADVLSSILSRPCPRVSTFRPDLPGDAADFFDRAFDRSRPRRVFEAADFRPLLESLRGGRSARSARAVG